MCISSKNVVLKVSEIEAKVKEATNRWEHYICSTLVGLFSCCSDCNVCSEAWGPSGTILNDISAATTDDQQKAIILSTLWERLR